MYTIREITQVNDVLKISEPRTIEPNFDLLDWKTKSRLESLVDSQNFMKMEYINEKPVPKSFDIAARSQAIKDAHYEIVCVVFGLSLTKNYVAEDVEKLIEVVEDRDFLRLKIKKEQNTKSSSS